MQSSDLGDMLFFGTNKRADLRYVKPSKNDRNVHTEVSLHVTSFMIGRYQMLSKVSRTVKYKKLQLRISFLPFIYFECKHNMGLNLWLLKMCFYFTLPCPVAYFTSTRTKGLVTSNKIDRCKRKKTGLVFLSFFFFFFFFVLELGSAF